jgi:hypothetical protein
MNKSLTVLSLLLITLVTNAQNKGYLNITSFGVLAGTSTDQHEAPISFISEHHYRFNRFLSAGLMTGIEQLNENTMPFALNSKFYIPARGSEYFLSGYIGYAIALEKPPVEGIEKAKGGIMGGFETGFYIPVNPCFSLIMGIGYRYNELEYELEDWWVGMYKRKYTYNRFTARIGLVIQ